MSSTVVFGRYLQRNCSEKRTVFSSPTNAINYFRSIKINTVGDIARSTASQIEVYPIPPPKLANIQKALTLYQERLVTSPSLSPIIGPSGEFLTPIASTSEEPIGTTKTFSLMISLYLFSN